MTVLDPAHEAARVEIAPPSGVTARVTMTVVLPPEALVIALPHPDMISQINVEQALGIPSRIYLELLREDDCPLEVTSLGKLRLVDRDHLRRWLPVRGKAKRAAAAIEKVTRDDDDQLTVEEQVRLGIKPALPTAPRRR